MEKTNLITLNVEITLNVKNLHELKEDFASRIHERALNDMIKDMEREVEWCGRLEFSEERNAEGHWDSWYEEITEPRDYAEVVKCYKRSLWKELIEQVKSSITE